MLLSQLKGGRFVLFAALALGLFLVLHLLETFPSVSRWQAQTSFQSSTAESPLEGGGSESEILPCQDLKGAEDVVVVMRTGATEVKDKLMVHFDTTFKCYPNLVIFSDYEEQVRGYQIHDVLKNIDEDIKLHHRDFEHYQHVLQVGREGLADSELSGEVSSEGSKTGKNDNKGWVLDKWKFLPMLNSTLDLFPDKKWYIFVEPDTYIVWSNLLQWLPQLDPSIPSYFGSEVAIGEDIFAHGGSAFLLSNPALQAGAETYRSKTQDWHNITGAHWAGDCILGRALHDAGVELTWSWPMFQGGNPSLMAWDEAKGGRSVWCTPALSYHHLSPHEKMQLLQFEQEWLRVQQSRETGSTETGLPFPFWSQSADPILHHQDIFKLHIQPNLTNSRSKWSNNPEKFHFNNTKGSSLKDCKLICETDPQCLQYAIGPKGCYTDSELKLGRPQKGMKSGWLTERIETWIENLDQKCNGEKGWTVP